MQHALARKRTKLAASGPQHHPTAMPKTSKNCRTALPSSRQVCRCLRLAALASATPRTRIMACLCLLPEARCRKTSLFTSATSHLQTTCKSRAVGFQLFVLHNRENNNRQVPDVMPKPVKILLKLSASFGLLAWCTRARA